jgi:hypothetical protein
MALRYVLGISMERTKCFVAVARRGAALGTNSRGI